jgi:hypothetical protein
MQKHLAVYAAILTVFLLGLSCSKTGAPPTTSSFTIVNVVVNSNPLVTNFMPAEAGGKVPDTLMWFSSALQIGYGSYSELSSYVGSTPLSLSQISDTLATVWSGDVYLASGSIHTFFLIGADTTKLDTLFTTDAIPYYAYTGDSVSGLRVVNVSPGSNPISVDIQGGASEPLLSSIPYKDISSFQALPATTAFQISGYNIEFRDAASGMLITTYTLNPVVFRSVTLAFYGTTTSGQQVMSINNN